MPFWRLHYHIVWTTKGREPFLSLTEFDLVIASIKTSWEDRGVIVHAVGPMPDHVHVAASIPPALAVAEVVARWKGGASHLINKHRGEDARRFAWQGEYGALTVGDKALADVIAYVENQPTRHRDKLLFPALERDA
jgi:putative transposase